MKRSRFRSWYARKRRETDDRQDQSSDESEVELVEHPEGRCVSSESSSSEGVQCNDDDYPGNESDSDSEQSQDSVQNQDADHLRREHNLDLNAEQEVNVNYEDDIAVGVGSGEDDLNNTISSASGGSDNSDHHVSSEGEASSDGEGEASSDGEGEENVADDMPLFPGAHLTLRQSLLAILTFSIKHKLSGVCIADLLSLIALHCGPNAIGLKTLYRFKSYFSMIGKKSINCRYYCSVCEILLPNQNTQCNNCLGRHEVAYFLNFPIVDQLKVMYSRQGFRESLNFKTLRRKKVEDNLEDIYDGNIYQEQRNNGFLANPDNISFFMYFDGVSLFKSSKFSIWPLYLSINELKFQERVKKENVVLAGLWFGERKPNPNLFLNPLVDQMGTLETEGAEMPLAGGGNIRVRAKIIGAVADLPAKALFMRMCQYNGRHSCFNCLSSGGRYDLGNITIQVFPYSRNYEPRIQDDMIDFAERALEARQQDPDATVYGVRGPTLMLPLLPNIVECLGIDIMHGVFLNLMRTLLRLFFENEYPNEPFNIAPFVNIVDVRLKNIKPPSSFQRLPRSIKKELALHKASDLKYLMMYYSLPVFLGILPLRYWLHHSKLVSAISLLCQESVSQGQINSAEEQLHSYVSDFQLLYGVRHVGLNLHQLLHLCDVVRNLGPAWVYSCFFYESLNGDLSKLVHGTRHAALQISSSSSVFMNLRVMVNEMDNSDAKQLCLKFLSMQEKAKITEIIDHKTAVVGKFQNCHPVPRCVSVFIQDTFDFVGGRFRYFYRLKKKGVVYNSESYTRSKKKVSCYVQITHQDVPYLCKIISFVKWSSCNDDCPPRCDECQKCFLVVVKLYETVFWEAQEHGIDLAYLNKVKPTNNIRVFMVSCISTQCIYMRIDNEEYMAIPINSIETE